MRKKYHKLMVDGEAVLLRLTVAGQKRLKAEFGQEILETIVDAASDGEKMAGLLGAALNWKGSGNGICDGEELFDRLVDEGWCGQVQFGGLALDIAEVSGVLEHEQVAAMKAAMKQSVEEAFRQLEEGEAVPGEERTRPVEQQD